MIWAVLAPVIRWPLRSPWRLIGVIAFVILGVNVAGALNSSGGNSPARAAGSPSAAFAPSGGSTPEPTGPLDTTPANSGNDNSDALSGDPSLTNDAVAAAQAAAQFVAAWARPDLPAAAWQAGIRPLATAKLYAALQATDPANIPAPAVSGQPVQVALNSEAGVFDVPTRYSDYVRVFVELHANSWLATDVQPTN